MKHLLLLLILALTSCAAPAYKPDQRKAPQQAAHARHEENRITTPDGTTLFHQTWLPRFTEARAVFVMVHGLKDYGDRYAQTAGELAKAGYAVHAADLRGHGDSSGDRVWVDSFQQYLDDLDLVLQNVRKQHPNKRIFLFGHSMGGAIVTLYTIQKQPNLAGMVLSAPALGKYNVSGFKAGATNVFGSISPTLAVFSLDDEKFSRDPKVVADMKTDPLIYHGAAPARTAKELLGAFTPIQEKMETIQVPILCLHGTADELTNPQGCKDLVKRASSKDKTLNLYPGLFHDLLHEPEKDKVLGDLLAWLKRH
ncbi:lysophospholipase [bacterium]|jgi:alpha-beta hydrolase superfamily lysophospholipase|nr:lysophospholipase [bacterium]